MIISFKCKKTEQLFQRSQIAPEWRQIASVALRKLKGDRKGQYSIRINRQWRICFEFTDGDAYNVEIVDYH